jgi:hypothetical protein
MACVVLYRLAILLTVTSLLLFVTAWMIFTSLWTKGCATRFQMYFFWN